jgi:hypothetical protein
MRRKRLSKQWTRSEICFFRASIVKAKILQVAKRVDFDQEIAEPSSPEKCFKDRFASESSTILAYSIA